jgi:hypothetical protein
VSCLTDSNIEALNKLGYTKEYANGRVFKLELSKDNMKTFQYYNEAGKKIYINSLYNTKKEIDNLLKDIDFDKDNLFIVYGIGMGYHIKEIYNRMTKSSYILVIEKDKNILSTFMEYNDFSELINKNTLFFFGNEREIIEKVRSSIGLLTILGSAINTLDIIPYAYKQIYDIDSIYNLNKELIEIIKHVFFLLGNDVQDTIDGFKNYIKNIKDLLKSPKLDCVKDKYINRPSIIVSAGPSLDKNVHLLKKAEGKALILATDAVLGTLKKHNITPDAVFTVERIWKTYEAFYKDKEFDKKIVFVGPTVVRSEILKTLENNKKLLFLKLGEGPSMWIGKNMLKEDKYLTTGASCAHTAFSFSQYIGADPIIFVGQDLAYTKDGVTHGKNVEIKQKTAAKDNKIWVEGVNGEKLPTNWALKNFLIWFEDAISKDKSERKYIDCTEGGAYKRGTKLMGLEEAIAQYCNEDIIRLNELVPEENKLNKKYLNSVIALKTLKTKLNYLSKKCKKHNRKLNRFLHEKYKNDEEMNFENIDKGLELIKSIIIVEKIILTNELFTGLFQPLVMAAVIKVRKLGCNIDSELIKNNMKIQIKMNKGTIWGCRKMLKVISKLINEITKDEDYIKLCADKGGKKSGK